MGEKLYRRINNPLDNSRFIKDVLYEYVYGDSLFDGLYRNKSRNTNSQSIIFHDVLFKSNYDDWKRKIDSLYESVNDGDWQQIGKIDLNNANIDDSSKEISDGPIFSEMLKIARKL